MMHLIRRRFGGARSAISTDDAEMVDSNPPPSYEDSQDASLQEVLQGARAVLPLLWPSTSDSPSSSTPPPPTTTLAPSLSKPVAEYESVVTNRRLEGLKSKETSSSPQQKAIIEVLSNLAMAPCNGRPFLDRIRQFSDFYFTPYMASEGDSSISSRPNHNDLDSHQTTQQREYISPQEKQREVLSSLSAPRESIALVLCARVLEEYYGKLGHVESAGEANIPRVKRKITQIAACLAEDCTCCDFDETLATSFSSTPAQGINPKLSVDTSPLCGCGHPRTSHSPSAGVVGLSRLLRRYTNWDSASYAALGHRSPAGVPKRRVVDIRVCSGGGGVDCACQDYDKGRRTGRCARCGHYDGVHDPVKVALEKQQQHDKWQKRKGVRAETSNATGIDPTQKGAEWELSWILVENAYLLFDRIAPLS
ncbi:hypothetical protein F5Y01DRAFT_327054 [Xylaria sp. FL0043]|nr:hypothetical protein F5Y01DRAFT_327054 [Xylaria sp. FL0043]